MRHQGKEDVHHKAAKKSIAIGPMNSAKDVMANEQYAARDYSVEVEHPEAGKHKYAGWPYRMSATPPQVGRAAPLLGQHNREIYCDCLGYSPEEFEQLERLVERTAKTGNDGYPPYNIEQTSDQSYRITLAVAGFREEDLAITVEDRQLVIRGRQSDEGDDRIFLHRGIAARQFQRSFVLADGVEVEGALMENGLLHVDLRRSAPESVLQRIEIQKGEEV